MKAKLTILIPLLLLVQVCWGQKEMGNFKQMHLIDLSGFNGNKFKYEPKDSLTILKKTNVLYDKNDKIVSYNKKKVKKAQVSKTLDCTVLDLLKLKSNWSKVNISVKDNKVFVFPYTSNNTANDFLKNNIYLELKERQNYSFKYLAWQMGVVTIPQEQAMVAFMIKKGFIIHKS